MKIPNKRAKQVDVPVSLARIVSEDSQHKKVEKQVTAKSSKDS